MGCLIVFLVMVVIGVVVGAILGPILAIGVFASKAKARKEARAIVNREATATPEKINSIIDVILKLNDYPSEEERDLVEKLRAIKREMEQS